MGCQLFLIVVAIVAGLCVSGLRRSIKHNDEQEPADNPKTRRPGAWTFVIVITALTLAWNWTCFSTTSWHLARSPDAVWELLAEARCAFPRNNLIDPAQVVGFRLVATNTGKTLALHSEFLGDNYFVRPEVEWIPGGVRISRYGSPHHVELDLVIPPK